jgi:uncharacterized membrane protein YfcA
MSVIVLLALVAVGLLVGFASGLIGIGGGVLMVPFLYFFYAHPAWSGTSLPLDLHTIVAHATSLFVIVPTAVRGTLSYHRAGLVIWRAAIPIAAASALATIAGTSLAQMLPGPIVRLGFGLFLLVTAAQLIWRRHSVERRPLKLNVLPVLTTGIVVGLLSGMLGIGGGAMASALMIQFLGLDLKQAAATSLAVVSFAAVVGSITWAVRGWGVEVMPPGSLGYIHVLAGVPMLLGSALTVHYGTVVNRRLPDRLLKGVFAAFFTLLAVYLIWENVGAL